MSYAQLSPFMKKIVKILLTKFFIFFSMIFLSNCAVNNSMMAGSQIAEIALPLSFESQKRKIQKYPNNSTVLFKCIKK